MIDKKILDRFWSKIDIKGPDECWEWKGGKSSAGYGVFEINKKYIGAHRFSYIINNGDIPDHTLVCHSCDNPPCCNPNHLFNGTYKDNAVDRNNKCRQFIPLGNKGRFGKPHTEETKQKMRDSAKKREKQSMTGKFHTEETKRKMSEKAKLAWSKKK